MKQPQPFRYHGNIFTRHPMHVDNRKRATPTLTTSNKLRPLRCPNKHSAANASNLNYKHLFHLLPSYRFQALLTLFPKFFSPFLHSTCLLSVLGRYLALRENCPAFCAPVPKNATLIRYAVRATVSATDGILTLYDAPFQKDLHRALHWRY